MESNDNTIDQMNVPRDCKPYQGFIVSNLVVRDI